MTSVTPEDLKKAHKEKDPRVIKRMAAASMVCMRGESIRHAADSLMQCPDRAPVRVERLGEGGVAALRDLPRSGRPPAMPRAETGAVMEDARRTEMTPVMARQKPARECSASFRPSYVGKIMRQYGITPKTAARVHASRAARNAVYGWQNRLDGRISRLKMQGLAMAAAGGPSSRTMRRAAAGTGPLSERG